MNTTEKDIELFDSYMNGTMSDTDRAKFEERLQNDEAYRKAYELHSEVVFGIQRKELKAMLQEKEILIKEEQPTAASVVDGGFVPQKTKEKNNTPKRFKLTYFKLAIAACFFIGVFVLGYDFWKLSSLGGDYIAQLETPASRGSGLEETIGNVRECLQKGKYYRPEGRTAYAYVMNNAQDEIDKARRIIEEEQKAIYSSSEETEYHQQMLKMASDELDWCQALLYAKTHKIFKAKKLLKQIAKSDSRYSEDAKRLLK